MKRVFILICGLLLSAVIRAQVTIQPNVPIAGLVQKSQLWNILVVNSGTASYDCRIELVLRDRATGQEVFTATTGLFVLPPGAKQVNVNTLNPIQYNYLVNTGTNSLQGLIPAGMYTACYIVRASTVDKTTPLAEDCIQFDTEPLSPPMLIFPTDSSELEASPAQFSWIPPTPVGMFDRLQYDVLITEVKEGQKADEAIQQNLPFYSDGNVFSNFLNYPSSAQGFEKDKWYAWQVVARDDRSYAGKSEVWVFKVKDPKKTEASPSSYVLLKSVGADQGTYYLNSDKLNIKYYSYDRAYTATIRLKRSDGKLVQEIKQKTEYGDNLFSFKLGNNFREGQLYVIELTDPQGKTHTALFGIQR